MDKEKFYRIFNQLDFDFTNRFDPVYNQFVVKGTSGVSNIELYFLQLMQSLDHKINFLTDVVGDKLGNKVGDKNDDSDSLRKNVKCPYCNESYFKELSVTRQAAYYPPIYKDGININPDKNKTFTRCHCMNCGKDFTYITKLDELIEIRGDENE